MTKKYIEADKFWNRLISVSENDWVGFDTIDEVLSGMPTAVVQCEDCKHWDSDALCCSRKNHYIVNAEANDYCSYGVRKMDDREEAIDILTRMSTNHFYSHREQEAFKLGAEALTQRWIPVTERLPGKEGLYLITCVDDSGTPFVDASLYDPPTDRRGAIWDFSNVVAWMERPEPYKGKEEC